MVAGISQLEENMVATFRKPCFVLYLVTAKHDIGISFYRFCESPAVSAHTVPAICWAGLENNELG